MECAHVPQGPTIVAVYELVGTAFERAAEFRLTDAGTVELTLDSPDSCPLAQRWFTSGVRVPGQREPITPANGHAFMEALLQPRRMSYCRVVDESSRNPKGPNGPTVTERYGAGD